MMSRMDQSRLLHLDGDWLRLKASMDNWTRFLKDLLDV
jgi:hypothetical protein